MENISILIGILIGFTGLIVTMFLNLKSGVNKLSDKVDALGRELRGKIDGVASEVSNLSQRVAVIELAFTGSANIPPLPTKTKPSPQKATKKTEPKATKPKLKSSTATSRKTPQRRTASYTL